MPATVQAQIATGAGGTLANAEGGFTFNREDTINGPTPIPIPTSTGTQYSWLKWLCLVVTATSTTSISNRRVSLASSLAAGLAVFFQGNATYAQAANGNMPAATSTNGPAVPSGFAATTTALQSYDATSALTNTVGVRNGNFCELVLGVDSTYTGGANATTALPNITLTYDEA